MALNATNTTITSLPDVNEWASSDTIIGIVLAFLSCFFIGVSVIIKKRSLQDMEVKTAEYASMIYTVPFHVD